MSKTILTLLFALTTLSLAAQDKIPGTTLTKMDGKKITITEAVAGQPLTVINFWATWCAPCKKELENIVDLYPEWKEQYNMEFIAVSIDDARTRTKVKPYVDGKGLPYYILLDENKDFFHALNGITPPLTLIVNDKGEILDIKTGYVEGDEYNLEDKLKKFAKKP